jgi:hypothetical protein
MALLAPLLATPGALLNVLDEDVERCSPTTAWGSVKLNRLATDGVLGGDTASLLGGVLGDVGRCLEGS